MYLFVNICFETNLKLFLFIFTIDVNLRTNCNSMPRCVMRYLHPYSFILLGEKKRTFFFILATKDLLTNKDVFTLD